VSRAKAASGAALLAALLPSATGPAAASAGPAISTGAATSSAAPISLPLATTLPTPAGTWATLPMGHLDDPENTFWQLFFEPKGTQSWSDRVEATGVATNGGIVMTATAKSLVVGVLPSVLLAFSPLIATTNWGRSWSTGLVEGGLAHVPSALAEAPTGAVLALSRGATGGPRALYSPPGPAALQSWRGFATAKALSGSTGGHRCNPVAITAVGYDKGVPTIGTQCKKAGSLGVFEERSGRWALVGPAPAPAAGAAGVLGFVQTARGIAAVAEAPSRQGAAVLAAWHTPTGPWRSSPPLAIPAGAQLASLGPAGGAGVFVLLSGGNERLAVAGPGQAWHQLPTPPAGTETIAFGVGTHRATKVGPDAPDGSVTALAVNQSTLNAWALVGSAWRRGQVVHVSIQYGSSSF
jgi:hypothetical protein